MQTEAHRKDISYKHLVNYANYLKEHKASAFAAYHAAAEGNNEAEAAFNSCFTQFIGLLAENQYEQAEKAWEKYLLVCDNQRHLSIDKVIEMKHKVKNFLFSHVSGFTDSVETAVALGSELADFLFHSDIHSGSKYHLQESERLYRQAEVLGNIGNWKWNIQTGKIEWTDHLYTIYGLEPQSEAININTFLSFIHPDDRNGIEHSLKTTDSSHQYDYTFRIITSDGKIKTLRSIAKVEQTDEDGSPLIMVGTERDITEKQALIDRLKESENLYKQAQSLAHIGNWTLDLASGNINWSDELYRIFGLEPQSVRIDLDRYISLMQYEDPEAAVERLNRYIREQKPYEFYRTIIVDGKPKHLHSHGEMVLDAAGQPYKLIGTAQDITETYRIEQELKGNQNLISKIADAAPSVISSYNVKTGEYTYINRSNWMTAMRKLVRKMKKITITAWAATDKRQMRKIRNPGR